ncbi:hypothetical protein JRO89_XS14G0096900 [Xanthoceras sorbifolium]|uniref:Autophagy-related protein 27 n=1 Tax=Xanthoceras sorbifolium TaxID=99658 RepID=A0ABQ8H4R5_9ROSI|nr:hypothetical protein JRO89_XS14G0096900 [Xanthoceras sorbifolium]
MIGGCNYSKCLLIILSTILHRAHWVAAVCEYSFVEDDKLYSYSLAFPLREFPHGVLSEDGYSPLSLSLSLQCFLIWALFILHQNAICCSETGPLFYKVAVNETVLWFQLCDGMIFNHDLPRCVGCLDCGGPSRCGSECSALVANNIGGYLVCTTLGHVSSTVINVMDKQNPHKGVIVKTSRDGTKHNCSLSVSVICDSNGVQGPQSIEKSGTCDYVEGRLTCDMGVELQELECPAPYCVTVILGSQSEERRLATVLRHPSGCAKIASVDGRGWGWFGTFITVILCLFGSYLLAGAVYRYFALGIRGVDVIPNLDVWATIPHRTQSFFASLVRRFKGPSEGHRSTYSRVNF